MRIATVLAVFAASLALPAAAQYPTKPIEMIVPIAPGGGLDIQARMLAELAEAELKQRIVIVNKPGAGGTIGVTLLTQAKPDGYTLAAVWSGPLTASPHNQPVPYALADYVPIVQFSKAPFVVCVAPDFPADTGQQLIAHLKQNPDRYSYGNEGAGGTLDLGLARIFAALGVSQLAVPFAGAADTARNFAGGHITMYAGGIASILPLAKAGKAKCLVMTSAARNPLFPAAAGLEDLGVAQAETVFWRAVIAPRGIPDEVRARLVAAFTAAARNPKFVEFLAGLGEVPSMLSGAALADFTHAEYAALGALAKNLPAPKK
jgi:tripartite-type tricarboxylate transporter receptor subunit TctC